MAALEVFPNTADEASVGTAVSRIVTGDGVDYVWITASGGDLWLFQTPDLADGDTVVGALLTNRYPIRAGVDWPVAVVPGLRIGVAAQSGSVTVNVRGVRE